MKFKVRFIQYEDYWVAEAENGAVTQGFSLEECKENIIDAIHLLESSKPKQQSTTEYTKTLL